MTIPRTHLWGLDPLDLSDPSPNELTRTGFSERQKSILNAFFWNGMTEISREISRNTIHLLHWQQLFHTLSPLSEGI